MNLFLEFLNKRTESIIWQINLFRKISTKEAECLECKKFSSQRRWSRSGSRKNSIGIIRDRDLIGIPDRDPARTKLGIIRD